MGLHAGVGSESNKSDTYCDGTSEDESNTKLQEENSSGYARVSQLQPWLPDKQLEKEVNKQEQEEEE